MYPFGGLPENLVAFCAWLRREYGFSIGPGEVHDAARALEIVNLAEERAVRDALRPILSRTIDDVTIFDEAFDEFFFPGPRGVPQAAQPAERRARGTRGAEERSPRGDGRGRSETEASEPTTAAAARLEPATADEPADVAASLARARASALEAAAAPEASKLSRAEPAWREAARLLVRRLELGLTRRWRPAAAGQRFDLRRTLRASLQTGGESLVVRWLRRPKRAPTLVLFVDGSRSMAESASLALQMGVALATVTMRVEVFTFSTGLERITDRVRRAVAGETVSLAHLQRAWGGGTAIGASLRDFLRRFGDRLLGRNTLVLIASDGLDVGDIDLLRGALQELRRRSAGIVWLNPLLETAGYEPTARGMLIARRFVSTFASVSDPAGLARLARGLRVRA